jgi:trigger factor
VETNTRAGDEGTLVLEVMITDKELAAAINEGVRHLASRTRIPGFRPGKVPRQILERSMGIDRSDPDNPDPVYDEAREHLYQRTVVAALQKAEADVLEIPAEPDWTSFKEGAGAAYTVKLPVRPEVTLGDYESYPFEPEIEPVTEERIDQVVEQLRDQQATLIPVEDRPAAKEDFAVVSFEGRRDGEIVEGARSERFPLIIGSERMIPGFEDNLIGMAEDEEKVFTVTFPEDYGEEELAGQEVEFTARILELRERRLPEANDEFAAALGAYEDMAALRSDLHVRMTASAFDRARHAFSDRIIEYATANATVEIPHLLVDREVEVMTDELKVRLSEQGIGYEDYLKVIEKDEPTLRGEYHEPAGRRVKVLLVLGAIAEKEEVAVPDDAVEAEIARVRDDDGSGEQLTDYLDSDRGRSYVRSQLRRSLTVELLVDRYIETHPQYADVQHQHQAPDAIDLATHDHDDEHDHDHDDDLIDPAAEEVLVKGAVS